MLSGLRRSLLQNGRIRSLALAAVCAVLSCTTWSSSQWRELENKTFYFNKFSYYIKGGDRKTAFDFMKTFPVKDMFLLIEKKYSISVDMSEFSGFLDGRKEDEIKVFGVILPERFTWESGLRHQQTIDFEYENRFIEDTTDVERRFSLTLKTAGKIRATVTGTVPDMNGVIKNLSARLEPE